MFFTVDMLIFYAGKTYYDPEIDKEIKPNDGKLHGKVILDQYVGSGDYYLDYVNLCDAAGNETHLIGTANSSYNYYSTNYPERILPQNLLGMKKGKNMLILMKMGMKLNMNKV